MVGVWLGLVFFFCLFVVYFGGVLVCLWFLVSLFFFSVLFEGFGLFCLVFLENANVSISQKCRPTDLSVTAVSGFLSGSLLPLFSLSY